MKTFDELYESVNVNETPEKFRHFKDEIISLLLPVLQKLCQLENEISNSGMNTGTSADLWKEYRRSYAEAIHPIGTESLLKQRGIAGAISTPARYDYPNMHCKKISFIMKSPNKAIVEIHYKHGSDKADQFIFVTTEEGWKLNEKKQSFSKSGTWHKDII